MNICNKKNVLSLLCILCSTAVLGQYGAPDGEWHTWGGDHGFTRYSALDQINADNVANLEVVWRWRALPLRDRPDRNYKATPLLIDGVLYTPTGEHQIAAIDPASGATLWVFTPDPPDISGRGLGLGSRSLAYWTDGLESRIYHNTLDGRLISVNTETGTADPLFGDNGQIMLKDNLLPPGDTREVPHVSSSSPAAVVGDVIVAQVVGDITAANQEATPGHIRGFDVRTGELLWTFHTIPQEGEFGNDTWENDSWRYTGNTGVWSMMSVDEETGYIYLPVEAPSNDFYGGHRLGDNLFSQSIVCLDAATGERVWHFQLTHHDVWDFDPPAAPILHDLLINGETIKAVTQLTKQSMSFVFNRVTGEPIWPIEERAVPQGDVPGERLSPTQPFPSKPPPYTTQGYNEDDLIDFTPELRAEAVAIAEQYLRGPMYTPVIRAREGGLIGTWVNPGYQGGSNWNGAAFDPETGMMFVPVRNAPMVASVSDPDPERTDWNFLRDNSRFIQGPRGLPIMRPPWSVITGTDMNAGEHRWSRGIGPASDYIRNHPDLQGLGLDFDNMGHPMVRPTPLATKTLMFMAESGHLSGDPGGKMFRAYDKATGDVVAEIELPEKATGAPMTYMHRDRQYIVVAIASAEFPAELVALALPGAGSMQVKSIAEPDRAAIVSMPVLELSEQETRRGRDLFVQHCASCHGADGLSSPGGAPALAGLYDLSGITQAINDGGVGMPSMRALLSEADIEMISRFVAAQMPLGDRNR